MEFASACRRLPPHSSSDLRCRRMPAGTSRPFWKGPASWRGNVETARPRDRSLPNAQDVLGFPHCVGDDPAQRVRLQQER